MNLRIYVDGGARGNPGPAAAGVAIYDADQAKPVHEAGYFLGRQTNNTAEYRGLLLALEVAVKLGATHVSIFSDSQLMVRQIQGQYRVKSPDLKPLYEQAGRLLQQIDRWQITHVYRKDNQRADELANLAMDAKQDVVIHDCQDTVPKSAQAASGAPDDPGNAPEEPGGPLVLSVTLEDDPGSRCPAKCKADQVYRLGPEMPAGFCMYAAAAVLKQAVLDQGHEPIDQAVCPLCGVSMVVRRDR